MSDCRETEYPTPSKIIKPEEIDYEAMRSLFAMINDLDKFDAQFSKRFRLHRNGKRELKMIKSLLLKNAHVCIDSFPPEKRESLVEMLPRFHYKSWCGNVSSDPEMILFKIDDVRTLLRAAHENCKLCMGMGVDCNRCGLGKMLTKHMINEKDDYGWGMSDFGDWKAGEPK